MKRRDFLTAVGTGTMGLLAGSCASGQGDRTQPVPTAAPNTGAGPSRPNIIVIVGDDLGYGELGCYGGKEIPTPHLDALAAGGVRFTNGYVSCPVCSPTRAGLMTGRYQQRFGHEFNPGPQASADLSFGLPLTEATLADRLKAAGYATGMVGKWHLGYEPAFHPLKRGVDEFFGFLGGAHPYLPQGGVRTILRGTEPVEEKMYLTDAFTREALAFLDRRHKGPFFLYLTYNAVHAPMQATPRYLDRFPRMPDGTRKTFAAMLSALDDGVGAVMKKLRELGVERDTLLWFVSDNGGPTRQTTSGNGPLSGFKGGVNEGGIRVPFMVRWPSRLPQGQVYDQPVIALDIAPTSVAAAGGTMPADRPIDGVDLAPCLTGGADKPPHEALYWRFGRQAAVRQGPWKLIRQAPANGAATFTLYDLATDVGEQNDLAGSRAPKLEELKAALGKWEAQLIAPKWGGPARPRARAARTRPARAQ